MGMAGDTTLPLGHLLGEAAPRRDLSRAVRQRVQRRHQLEQLCNGCVDGINWLGGYRAGGQSVEPMSPSSQLGKDILRCCGERLEEEMSFSESAHEALGALLRDSGPYSTESVGGFAPYVHGSVSLLADVSDAPALETLLEGSTRESVVRFDESFF